MYRGANVKTVTKIIVNKVESNLENYFDIYKRIRTEAASSISSRPPAAMAYSTAKRAFAA